MYQVGIYLLGMSALLSDFQLPQFTPLRITLNPFMKISLRIETRERQAAHICLIIVRVYVL